MKRPLQTFSFSLYLIVSILGYSRLYAQERSSAHAIKLKAATLHPIANSSQWLDSMAQQQVKEPVQALIQFEALPTPAQRATLATEGITLLDYIPDNTYTAIVRLPVNAGNLIAVPIRSIVNEMPTWKASDYLWKKVNDNMDGNIEILASFYKTIDSNSIREYIKQIGGIIEPGLMEMYGGYKIMLAASKVNALAAWYGTRYINPVQTITPLDEQSIPAIKANLALLPAVYGGYGLAGDSVTIGVGDNTSGIYHIDTKDRVINYNPAAVTHHGEFVNGVVGGAAIIDPLAAGMAPHSLLIDHLYDNVLYYEGTMLQNYNMTITNNSYANTEGNCSYEGIYDNYANFADQLCLKYNDVSNVFAAGNDGLLNCGIYPAGFGTVIGGYQPAKNVITVGSITDYFYQAPDESRGPVRDGRLKPEIVAIGQEAYAPIGDGQYEWAAGTSFASPHVAGALALLTQRYRQLHGPVNPPADVLKTILLDGATDIGNPGPDFTYGFGSMNVYKSLQILDSNRFIINTIENNQNKTIALNVPVNTGQLKVMLYWQDVPANPASAYQLVNDLDLSVQTPSLQTHLPLVLDTLPANITNNATEQADHLNNVEQVVITNPAAGNYTINVKGYNVTTDSQRYVIAYDFLPTGVQLTYPTAGEKIINSDTLRFFWEAVADSNTYTVQFSQDNGSTWSTLANNIPAGTNYYSWMPGNINSGRCLARVLRNNTSQVSTSGQFIMNTQPTAYLDSVQCPGYIKMNWPPVINATAYQILRKKGFYMEAIDTVSDTTYILSGLSLDSTYYVSVAPIINGMAGYRSIAVTRRPNTGTCAESYSNGDLSAQQIAAPINGRQFTSLQLNNNTPLTIKVRNHYSSACAHYKVSYNVDGGAWQSFTSSQPIPANSTLDVSTPGINLSAIGTYHVVAAVANMALPDPVPQNDTIAATILTLPNDPLDLTTPFLDGFEGMSAFTVINDSIGVSPNGHWDFTSASDSGRMRTFIDDSITISGHRSISLDANQETAIPVQNYFTGTFNLSNYDTTADEVRFQFDYLLHGIPKSAAGNQVWVRGSDTQPWVSIYNYDLTTPGSVDHSGTLSITDALRGNNQNFSTSSQVRFGQSDTSLIAARSYGNGVTLDNFTIYTVQNDVGIAGIVSPATVSCGAGAATPLTILVYNGVKQAQHNIRLYYQLDSGSTIADTLATLPGKDTIAYTFPQTINIAMLGAHELNVWLVSPGDTYHPNDSILNYRFRNEPLVDSFPYLQNFEVNDGYWYTAGVYDSWQYGTPASANIHKAASGTKAWKTNLTGNYNNNEHSYLYSPCFDISALANPMLSFSMAMKIENCGTTLCDAAYMEYSYDGATWTKLGAYGQGTNWYDSTFQVWNEEGTARWHVASIPLPASPQPIRLRFVMAADPGVTFDGIAVDDIHIYDLKYPIYNDSATATQNISGNQWNSFTQSGDVLAQMETNGQSITATTTEYAHTDLSNPSKTQYFFPKSFTIKAQQPLADTAGIRLYILDSDVLTMINDTSCPTCTKPTDAYSLGITKYDNSNADLENGLLTDNVGGTYTYYPYSNVVWVPYDQGYYAQVKAGSLSEFWFNDGGITHTFPVGVNYIDFAAHQQADRTALATWTSYIDTLISNYALQRSYDTVNFVTIDSVTALHQGAPQYSYTDTPQVQPGKKVYYRLKWKLLTDSIAYSDIQVVDWTVSGYLVSIYPNPNYDGNVHIAWNADEGTPMQMSLLDETNRIVYKGSAISTAYNNISTFSMPHYANGVYYIEVIIGGKKFVEEIMFNRQ